MPFDLKNKKVTIIGAARSGVAVAEVVLRLRGIAKISESKPFEKMDGVIVESGGHTRGFIEDSDYVVLSPGVRLDAQPVQWARARGIEVMGEVEFASRLCPCPIVAITGSNGKTTTATLIAEILKNAGRLVCLCGNIGSPLSKYVLDLKASDTVVLEISSFQLESTVHFKPHVAVWTNFSQNHLDRHKDLDEYFQAKCKIFANQDDKDFAVINFQDGRRMGLIDGSPLPNPPRQGEGIIRVDGMIRARVLYFNGPDKPVGVDNPNYLAAMQVAHALGIGEDVCRKVFADFKGVEHRLEFVRLLDGVDYINDSKSTTLEASRWALERADKPVILICGGSDKKLDYAPLRSLVAKKVKYMATFGQIREIIRNTFADVVKVDMVDSMQEAVNLARRTAKPGETVLLSPMTASFDMFKDYEDRGRCFKEIVNNLT